MGISLKFYSLDKMIIASSESKDNSGRSENGLIAYLGLKSKYRPNNYKKARYAIGNVSKKDLSKIIREFKNFLMKYMRGRGPNRILPTITFT